MSMTPTKTEFTLTSAGPKQQITSDQTKFPTYIYVKASITNKSSVYLGTSDVSSKKFIASLAPGQTHRLSAEDDEFGAKGVSGLQASDFWFTAGNKGDSIEVTFVQSKMDAFKDDAEKMGISQESVYLLRKFQTMHDELSSLMDLKTKTFIRYSGSHTTLGGATTEEVALVGVKAGMGCIVQISELGSSPVNLLSAKTDIDKLVLEFSADPSTDHVLNYFVTITL